MDAHDARQRGEAIIAPREKSPAYTDDYYLWWERQLTLMQAGRWTELDFENVVDEFADLGILHRQVADTAIEETIVRLLAINVCSSYRLVFAPTILQWEREIETFRGSLIERLYDSPGLKGVLAEDYPRLWKQSLSSLLRKLQDIKGINQALIRSGKEVPPDSCGQKDDGPDAHDIVRQFNRAPCFPIEECVGFDLNEHKRSIAAIDYDGKWLYPADVREAIVRANKEHDATTF